MNLLVIPRPAELPSLWTALRRYQSAGIPLTGKVVQTNGATSPLTAKEVCISQQSYYDGVRKQAVLSGGIKLADSMSNPVAGQTDVRIENAPP